MWQTLKKLTLKNQWVRITLYTLFILGFTSLGYVESQALQTMLLVAIIGLQGLISLGWYQHSVFDRVRSLLNSRRNYTLTNQALSMIINGLNAVFVYLLVNTHVSIAELSAVLMPWQILGFWSVLCLALTHSNALNHFYKQLAQKFGHAPWPGIIHAALTLTCTGITSAISFQTTATFATLGWLSIGMTSLAALGWLCKSTIQDGIDCLNLHCYHKSDRYSNRFMGRGGRFERNPRAQRHTNRHRGSSNFSCF